MSSTDVWLKYYKSSRGYLAHHGIKGQKWGVRNGPPYPLKKQQKSGILKYDLQFFGNKKRWSEYDVEYPGTDKKYHIADGARVLGQEIFAGKGTSDEIREVTKLRLADAYGGDPEDWQKCKGHTVIDCDGEEVKAEIHWYQEESAGKVELKIKRWEE